MELADKVICMYHVASRLNANDAYRLQQQRLSWEQNNRSKNKKIKWNNIILHFVYLMIMNETSAPIVAWKCNFSSHPLGNYERQTNQPINRPTDRGLS